VVKLIENSGFRSLRNKPVNLNLEEEYLFEHEYSYNVPPFVITKIDNALLVKDTVFDVATFSFFASDTHINGYFSFKQKLNYLRSIFILPKSIERGIWITQNWTHMYFHWITDALTRLVASESFLNTHSVVLPISYTNFPFVKQSLEFLGYSIVWKKDHEVIKVKELILPSHTSSPGNYNDLILSKLSTKFQVKKNSLGKKIFVSRLKAEQRFIQNETELYGLFSSYGIEVHFFEEYDFRKQIELLNQTSVLIGLHGAGLTNMIFMETGSVVVEIRNRGDNQNNCYFSMCSALKHAYYYLQGEGNETDTHTAVVNVELKELEKVITQIGIKKNNI
jgi:capsular polysaccharide biosynthesis protein